MSGERFIPVADVAAMLSLDSGEVIALIRSGALAGAVDVALPNSTRKRWRIPASALQQFLDARRSMPPTRRTRRRKAAAEPSYY